MAPDYNYADDVAPLIPAARSCMSSAGTTTRRPIVQSGSRNWLATVSARSTRWDSPGLAGTISPTQSTSRSGRRAKRSSEEEHRDWSAAAIAALNQDLEGTLPGRDPGRAPGTNDLRTSRAGAHPSERFYCHVGLFTLARVGRDLVLLLAHPGARAPRSNRSISNSTPDRASSHLRGMVEEPRRQLRDEFRVLEPELCRGAVHSRRPDNIIEPGARIVGSRRSLCPDASQCFSVTVPRDWGKKELVWTLTVRGKPRRRSVAAAGMGDRASRSPQPSNGEPKNQPPTIAVDAVPPITLPSTATLTAWSPTTGCRSQVVAVEESQPSDRRHRRRSSSGRRSDGPVNVPQVGGRGQRGAGAWPRRPQGPTVS